MDIDDNPVRIGKSEGFEAVVRTRGIDGQHIVVRTLGPSQGFDIFAFEGFSLNREIPLSPESHEEKRGVLFDVVAEWTLRFDDHTAEAVIIPNRDFERGERLGRE